MKECPNCKELIGDKVEICFNCRYDFRLGRIISQDEKRKVEDERQLEIQRKDEKAKSDALQRQILQEQITKEREETIQKNPLYEYTTDVIYDLSTGMVDQQSVAFSLSAHAKQGWRLHTIFTNEIGKTSSSVGISSVASSTNATMDVTFLVFERMIKKSEFYD